MADRFDLDAIEADDALLDLLAAGGESARSAGEHDPAVALLADLRLAVEVEDELPVETIDDPESFLARCAALNPMTDPFARKVATRGLAFGVAAVAALSVSGVAAAVTGDPLSPYEKVIEKMVDAVRPQTSFPKENVDGSPVVDRSKIVKVGKDFKEKAKAEHAAQSGKDGVAGDDDPQAQDLKGTPEVLGPTEDRPVATRVLPYPWQTDEQKTQEPVKPTTEVTATPKPTDEKTGEPTGTKTDEPTDTKTENPPDTPPSTPTEEPTDTTTPTPTPTDTTTPTPPPANGETGTGTGDTGTGDTGTGAGDNTVSDPTGTPSAGSGDGQTGGEETTPPGSDSTGTSDTSGDDTKPSSPVTQVPEQTEQVQQQVEELVEKIQEVLPTPTGLPVPNETAEQFFGTPDATAKAITTRKSAKSTKSAASGKHSSGKVTTGSVRKTYPTGKHSSGQYAEGKHAAIARTHGSTADASLLQILDVVNKPIR